MLMEQLKTYSDKVSDRVRPGLKSTSEAAKSGMNSVYTAAMNNPKATAAVVLGTGVAAALLWIATRNGTFSTLHKKVMARVKGTPAKRTRRSRAATAS